MADYPSVPWGSLAEIGPQEFLCGYCDLNVSSRQGYYGRDIRNRTHYIFVCPHCSRPTYFPPVGGQVPQASFGDHVRHIASADVEGLYNEARRCMSIGASTAAVLCCRKLLMNVSVSKGAPASRSFLDYVQYLDANGYIPPGSKGWVDYIRQKGNEANHEIALMTREEAEDLISFCAMLLMYA